MGANYRIAHPEGLKDTILLGDSIAMVKPSDMFEIRYTLDGTEPTIESSLYENPFVVESETILKARCFNKKGRGGSIYTSVIIK